MVSRLLESVHCVMPGLSLLPFTLEFAKLHGHLLPDRVRAKASFVETDLNLSAFCQNHTICLYFNSSHAPVTCYMSRERLLAPTDNISPMRYQIASAGLVAPQRGYRLNCRFYEGAPGGKLYNFNYDT